MHPPRTRRAARLARVDLLENLSEDLLECVGRQLLSAHDLCSLLSFVQTCKSVRARLASVTAVAGERRLQWIISQRNKVTDDGRTLTCMASRHIAETWLQSSGASRLLPKQGRSSWTVRIVDSAEDVGFMRIGVCDAALRRGWGFNGCSGQLFQETFAPADDLPDGHGKHLLFDGDGQQTSWNPPPHGGGAEGSLVQVIVDHDACTLGFKINGAPYVEALTGLPAGVELRPWVLNCHPKDRVQFVGPLQLS